MNLLEKIEREKNANENLLKRRKNKKGRPQNPFEIVIDNSKTFYIRLDKTVEEEERTLTYNPEIIFKEFNLEER